MTALRKGDRVSFSTFGRKAVHDRTGRLVEDRPNGGRLRVLCEQDGREYRPFLRHVKAADLELRGTGVATAVED